MTVVSWLLASDSERTVMICLVQLEFKDEPYRDFIRRQIDDLQKHDYSLSGMIEPSSSLG
jgi:hypothetical protein